MTISLMTILRFFILLKKQLDNAERSYIGYSEMVRTEPYVPNIFPRIKCVDGFNMSIQGHFGAYCSPRIDFAEHYSQVEIGFPSDREELIMKYAETPDDPTGTVYGYVPIRIVEEVTEKHGGIDMIYTKEDYE